MNVTLNAEQEKIIQREIDLGHFSEPNEVIIHALNLLKAEQEWFERNREAINEHLEESFAQGQRGEAISGEEAREYLARNRAARAAGEPAETASEFFRRRAEGASGEGLARALAAVPNRPPDPGDELED